MTQVVIAPPDTEACKATTLKFEAGQAAEVFRQLAALAKNRYNTPILEHALIAVENGKVSAIASDIETQLRLPVIAQAEADGEFTVPARKLAKILGSLNADQQVSLMLENEQASVRAGRSRFKLQTLPGGEFPVFEAQDKQSTSFALDATEFAELIERTYRAMATQDVRYYLNGLALQAKDSKLVAKATNGHRLAIMLLDIAPETEFSIIVPRDAVLRLQKIKIDAETVIVSIHETFAEFTFGDTVLSTKLVDGRFPDTDRVIPDYPEPMALTVESQALGDAIKRVALVTDDGKTGVTLAIDRESIGLSCRCRATNESAEDQVACESGAEATVTVMPVYLLDALLGVTKGKPKIGFVDGERSLKITDSEDERYMSVVMPMRT
jgi:DNA polymerase-3 subunit beta